MTSHAGFHYACYEGGAKAMMERVPLFQNRAQAGRLLAERLSSGSSLPDGLVLGLPRGGVIVADAVAGWLGLPMDIFLVRKLGVPGREELAMGAVASGGVRVINREVIESLRIPGRVLEAVTARERGELERRERLYRGGQPLAPLAGRAAVLVDDGVATGASLRAALSGLRAHRPARIVVAVPVGPPDTCAVLRLEADEVVCLETPDPFEGVGLWYEEFPQVTDEEVREVLRRHGGAA